MGTCMSAVLFRWTSTARRRHSGFDTLKRSREFVYTCWPLPICSQREVSEMAKIKGVEGTDMGTTEIGTSEYWWSIWRLGDILRSGGLRSRPSTHAVAEPAKITAIETAEQAEEADAPGRLLNRPEGDGVFLQSHEVRDRSTQEARAQPRRRSSAPLDTAKKRLGGLVGNW